MEQGTVTSLVEKKGTVRGVQYKTKDGQELSAFAPLTIVCDGCFSNLQRSLCNPKAAKKEKKGLAQQVVDLTAQCDKLTATLQQNSITTVENELKQADKIDKLQTDNAELQQQLKQHTADNQRLHTENEELTEGIQRQHQTLTKALAAAQDLEAQNEKLKQQAQVGTPELRKQIIEEYKGSQDLVDEICDQYGKGFQMSVDKATKAGVDPSVFSDSDDDQADN